MEPKRLAEELEESEPKRRVVKRTKFMSESLETKAEEPKVEEPKAEEPKAEEPTDEELKELEEQFVKVYGVNTFYNVYEYIKFHDILDFYMRARENPEDLCLFGFHYGIVPIVTFCYCVLKVPLDINNVVSGYFKCINSTTLPSGPSEIGVSIVHEKPAGPS